MENINLSNCNINIYGDCNIGESIKCKPFKPSAPNPFLEGLDPELSELYAQVPEYDWGRISLIHGDILRFESAEQFENTCEHLTDQYYAWSRCFIDKYGNEDEDTLDEITEKLGFDPFLPLVIFEKKFHFFGKSLRDVYSEKVQKWAETDGDTDFPLDKIVTCSIEQTLFSKYHEICIGDTICQVRPDGVRLYIPLSELQNIAEIRNADGEVLNNILEKQPEIIKTEDPNSCYQAWYYASGTQEHNANENKFVWTYSYQKAWVGHMYRTTVTMLNIKRAKKKWKNAWAYCALGAETATYSYMIKDQSCSKNDNYTLPLNNTLRLIYCSRTKYTRSVLTESNGVSTTIGPVTFIGQDEIEELHINPVESHIKCRHNGWTFTFYFN